jgi:tight adherence protein B
MLGPIIIFVLVLTIVVGAYWLAILRPEGREQAVVRKRVKASVDVTRATQIGVLKDVKRLSSVPAVEALLLQIKGVTSPLQLLIEQSGLRLSVGQLLLACGCGALLPFLVVARASGQPLAGVVAGAIGAALPYLWVKRARAQRLWKFEEQFPEAVDLISRSLRSGHAFPTGMALVAEEMPQPVGGEFKLLYDRQNFGMPMPEALKDFARRIPVLDAQFFVTAVLTQREAGGNLAEVLDNLASVVRERFKVKRQVRVISAHGRITGWILAALPPVLALAFFIMSPKHMQTLLNDPLGIQMMMAAAVLQSFGSLVIRKIVNIQY